MERTSNGSDKAALTQRRLHIESYSGSACSPAMMSIGSKAMPQIGQFPGPNWTISGCIGHVYRIFCALAGGGASRACSIPEVPGAARNFSGPFSNRSLQRGEQKK